MARQVELTVIGAGRAGLAAARAAAALGLETLLVDENPIDPANIRRNIPYWYGPRAAARAARRRRDPFAWLSAHPGLAAAIEDGVEVLLGSSVFGLFSAADDGGGHVIGVFDGAATSLPRSRAVILATGATDLHLAFPGWTLGGVFGARGAFHLLELSAVLEARRMLVLGGGNLAQEVARRSRAAGVDVVGMVELDPTAPESEPDEVTVWRGYTVREALGGAELERVVLAPVGGDMTEITLEVDALCVAIGEQPSVELAYLAGCALGYDAGLGGHYVAHDASGRTSRAGIFVAGGEIDGEVAGRAAAYWLDGAALSSWPDIPVHRAPLAGAYATPWHQLADQLAADDVVICRCEEVTRGDVLNALRDGCGADPDEVKRVSRAGMGLCQGRGCRPIVAGILAAAAGKTFGDISLSSYRPPVRPVPLAALATEESLPLPYFQVFADAEARLAAEAHAGRLAPLALMRFRRAAEEAAFRCARDHLADEQIAALAAELEDDARRTEAR